MLVTDISHKQERDVCITSPASGITSYSLPLLATLFMSKTWSSLFNFLFIARRGKINK
jgi:hypothetical protein